MESLGSDDRELKVFKFWYLSANGNTRLKVRKQSIWIKIEYEATCYKRLVNENLLGQSIESYCSSIQ